MTPGRVVMIVLFSATTLHAPAQDGYAGEQDRAIKALSAQEVDDHLNGRGMGYALAAELNHYPGPRHVLDMSEALGLTEAQEVRTHAIFEDMREKAAALGRQLVDRGRALDRVFAEGPVDAATAEALVTEVGRIEARIRHAHLSAHLEQMEVLTERQLDEYDRLRGYGRGSSGQHRGHR